MSTPKAERTSTRKSPGALTVQDVMTAQPLTVGRDQPLALAHAMMREHNIRHLPVLEGGALIGLVSQRDLYFLETEVGVDAKKERVNEAMTTVVYAVVPTDPLKDVVATMAERKLGCAVVMDSDRVIGIFTATDALRVLADDCAATGQA